MSELWHSYKAEFFKNKHSIFLRAHIVLPFLLVCLMTFTRLGKSSDLGIFSNFFKLMGFAFSLLAAVLCALIADQEKQAGHCQIMLSKLSHKTTSFVSQLCMLLTMCLGAIFFAILLFFISMKLILHINSINYLLYFKTGAFIFLCVIFLYSLYLILAYHFNTAVCNITGFAGVIICAVASTAQGDSVWMFLPWVWPIRFINFIVMSQYKLQGKIPPKEIFFSYTQNGLNTGLTSMIIMTICCIIFYILSFHFWEGRQK
ncbi:ABC-2 family transporter protein [Clostridium ragsdalei P11]|uniref:ABC-2 family transporter protein n=1 Tax=Clostridium ragsdalei P11 TaxID=1353534 RepID=A0A1A6B3U8_9CLOT|nr:lantibiotic immunity ABC transporter MutG family permease subunit [Clostridium ragsdalei]OBR96960.1 ABC-2 family transporter protein [Clostridium ragsdalei P11]